MVEVSCGRPAVGRADLPLVLLLHPIDAEKHGDGRNIPAGITRWGARPRSMSLFPASA
jgi:hypothetical protein